MAREGQAEFSGFRGEGTLQVDTPVEQVYEVAKWFFVLTQMHRWLDGIKLKTFHQRLLRSSTKVDTMGLTLQRSHMPFGIY